MTYPLDGSTDGPGVRSEKWHQLDKDVLRAVLGSSEEQSDSWWREYKRITQHKNDSYINSSSYVSGQIDDRWGGEFMANGWREVEHLTQPEKEKKLGNGDCYH
mgnify:CR=1 FL=1